MRLVSVEGLPCACRDAVTRVLQQRLECPALPAVQPRHARDGRHVHALAFLLAQARALKHVAAAPLVLSMSSWLDKAPPPDLAGLYSTLAECLRRRLGLPEGVHDMVYVRIDPHEAFECVIECGAEARETSLRDVLALQAHLDACAGSGQHRLLFPVAIRTEVPPRFVADAPRLLDALATGIARQARAHA